MPKGPSKSSTIIQRLLEERGQYEAWIVRLSAADDATPDHVRERVKADYEARLKAVTEQLRGHAEDSRQTIEQKKQLRVELQKKANLAAETLAEAELRHAVGEYEESQWVEVHRDALADLVAVREELQAIEAELAKLEELETAVSAAGQSRKPAAGRPSVKVTPPKQPRAGSGGQPSPRLDELAFIKSVTEDDKGSAPSARRASGAQYQPSVPATTSRPAPASPAPPSPAPPSRPARPSIPAAPSEPIEEDAPEPRTLRCRKCGTMNLATEWYCEHCGGELAV